MEISEIFERKREIVIIIVSLLLGVFLGFAIARGVETGFKPVSTPVLAKIDPLLISEFNLTQQREYASLRPFQSLPSNYFAQRRVDFTHSISPWGRDKGRGQSSVQVIIHLRNPDGLQRLKSIGLSPHSITGTIVTTEVSISQLEEIASFEEITWIEASKPLYAQNDSAIRDVRGDEMQGLGFKGKGVLFGFIDTGIDLNSPDFKDADEKTRVLYLWDQTDNTGLSPAGYTYGREWTKETIDITPPFDLPKDFVGHGTHSTGCAVSDDAIYGGMASEAEIIGVKFDFTGTAHFLEALQYLVDKAEAIGKPFALSVGWMNHYGPHDGTETIELMIDSLFNPLNDPTPQTGRGIAVAAGNFGGSQIHAGGTVSVGDSSSSAWDSLSVLAFTVDADGRQRIDCQAFYEVNSSELVRVIIPGENLGSYFVSSWLPSGQDLQLGPGLPGPVDRVYLFHRKPYRPGSSLASVELTAYADNVFEEGGDQWFGLQFFGDVGTKIDAWIPTGQGYFLKNNGLWNRLLSADDAYEIGPPGGAKRAITVGAYTTKNSWQDINEMWQTISGEIGDFAWWSSRGPLRDGNKKPDLCAPGRVIVSTRSADYFPQSSYLVNSGHDVQWGTSFSATYVAGAMIQLLNYAPNYSSEALANLLTGAARKSNGESGWIDGLWGYGKLDVLASYRLKGPTAVEFSWFEAMPQGNNILLIWETASEVDNYQWQIERNTDFTDEKPDEHRWTVIATIPGQGTKPTPTQYSFVDRDVTFGVTYAYRLVDIDIAGLVTYYPLEPIIVTAGGSLAHWGRCKLYQNAPNPFSSQTAIRYSLSAISHELSAISHTTLKIYNLAGQLVKTLINEPKSPGVYKISWDGRDDTGKQVANGIYFYRLEAGGFSATRKMILLR
ncbi:MAG: S8 family serine peptidase [Candidatus Edwardsbacteria bacterium]